MSIVLNFTNKKHLSSDSIIDALKHIDFSTEINSSEEVDFCQLYLPGVSTRGVFLFFEDEDIELKVNFLSSYEDYCLFCKCACELTSLLDSRALDEEGFYLDKESIKKKFDEDGIKEQMEHDAEVIYAMVTSKKDTVIDIDCVVRRVSIGNWTIKNIGCKSSDDSKALSSGLIKVIKRMQYGIPSDIGRNCLYVKSNDEITLCPKTNKEEFVASIYKWNETRYVGTGEYVLFNSEPFIDTEWECMAVPVIKIGDIAPDKWERLDENHFIPCDITEKEYETLWEKAEKIGEEKYSIPKQKNKKSDVKKIYLCAADSDVCISYNLAVLLEEKGYDVLPSSKELEKGPAKTKVKQSLLQNSDIAVVIHSWNSARSKKYVAEIDDIISKKKPIISISVTQDDYKAIDSQMQSQNEFVVDPNMNKKFTTLLTDINEMKDWLDYLAVKEDPYRSTEVDVKFYEEAMKYSDVDSEKKFKILEEGAIKGGANCQFLTGWCYFNGYGVKQNKNKAHEWDLKAAEQKQLQALNVIGIDYMEGESGEKNAELALKYLQMAAKFGLSCAAYNIGLMYDHGLCVEKNAGKALYWFVLSEDTEAIQEYYDKLTKTD